MYTYGLDFVDWEAGECHFDSEEFIDLLAVLKELPEQNEPVEYCDLGGNFYKSISIQFARVRISNLMGYKYLMTNLGDADVSFINSPDLSDIPGIELVPQGGDYAITVASKHKDGAWDFMKWLSGATGAKIIDVGVSGLPALKALYSDSDVTSQPGFSSFVDSLKLENGVQYPTIKSFSEYTSMINEQLDYVYAGKKTPEQAMADLAASAKNLK
jgi:hypothetical protein